MLDRDFNSLDAQGEVCAAYVLSQKNEEWAELSDRYDDGGFSGGTMDRPGLKQLLSDVEAARIQPAVWLAPDISVTILERRRPANLTTKILRSMPNLPLDWQDQRKNLGLPHQ